MIPQDGNYESLVEVVFFGLFVLSSIIFEIYYLFNPECDEETGLAMIFGPVFIAVFLFLIYGSMGRLIILMLNKFIGGI